MIGRKVSIILIGLAIVGVLTWGVIYALHSNLEESIEGNVLAIHNVSSGEAIAITEDDNLIVAEVY
ncbi:hypothetical protein [Jeotgalibacillus salarius]|uniref:Uncharacterized protein n=1 Tax=Jeotgalibacillus salarius TaxID=546023 RepID=A0A4Y8LHN3_9BACL|nr:hypothetical protein [Jeotgalibacillus salarius]TFE02244.1 hypothetical protein E2626_06605 [Jeotgalibacillus salarius]